MSTEPQLVGRTPVAVEKPLGMKEIAALLIRHYGLHDGKFDLLLEYQFGIGAVGPNKENLHPGVMVGIAKIGLTKSTQDGPFTVDASEINPMPRASKKSKTAARGA